MFELSGKENNKKRKRQHRKPFEGQSTTAGRRVTASPASAWSILRRSEEIAVFWTLKYLASLKRTASGDSWKWMLGLEHEISFWGLAYFHICKLLAFMGFKIM